MFIIYIIIKNIIKDIFWRSCRYPKHQELLWNRRKYLSMVQRLSKCPQNNVIFPAKSISNYKCFSLSLIGIFLAKSFIIFFLFFFLCFDKLEPNLLVKGRGQIFSEVIVLVWTLVVLTGVILNGLHCFSRTYIMALDLH